MAEPAALLLFCDELRQRARVLGCGAPRDAAVERGDGGIFVKRQLAEDIPGQLRCAPQQWKHALSEQTPSAGW
jgi:hypothetical protein